MMLEGDIEKRGSSNANDQGSSMKNNILNNDDDEDELSYEAGELVCDWGWKKKRASAASPNESMVASISGEEEYKETKEKVEEATLRNEASSKSVEEILLTVAVSGSDLSDQDGSEIDEQILTDLEEEEDEEDIDALIQSNSFKSVIAAPSEKEESLSFSSTESAVFPPAQAINIAQLTNDTTAVIEKAQLEEDHCNNSSDDASSCSSTSSTMLLYSATTRGIMPASFVIPDVTNNASHYYLDPALLEANSSSDDETIFFHQFAMEHKLFIRGIMDLLKDRDLVGVEANVDDPHTIKAGYLKEKHINDVFWKVKYVEVRQGILAFYNDNKRKILPLRASLIQCRSIPAKYYNRSASSCFMFELSVQGHPRRLWMASSNEERQSWIQAINGATIGGSMSDRRCKFAATGNPSSLSDAVGDFELFLKIQSDIYSSKTKESFMSALSSIFGSTLTAPIHWIKDQQQHRNVMDTPAYTTAQNVEAAHEDDDNVNIDDDEAAENVSINNGSIIDENDYFWKDLKKESVYINGFVVKGDSGWGPERIVGALTRSILDFDRSQQHDTGGFSSTNNNHMLLLDSRITEVQAIMFARDILLACSWRKSEANCHSCISTLCGKTDLVALCPTSGSHNNVINITIRSPAKKERDDSVKSGWIASRESSKKPWRSRFCMLLNGIISFYEKEHPNPHGLLEQIDLSGATIGISEVEGSKRNLGVTSNSTSKIDTANNKKYLICIVPKDRTKERQMCFDDQREFLAWQESLNNAISFNSNTNRLDGPSSLQDTDTTTSIMDRRSLLLASSTGAIKGDEFTAPKSPKNQLRQKFMGNLLSRGQTGLGREHNTTSSVTSGGTSNMNQRITGNSTLSTVEACVQTSAVYRICTKSPIGNDKKDTWAMVRVNLAQKFSISGGPNGRLQCIDETVRMGFLKGYFSNSDMLDAVFSEEA